MTQLANEGEVTLGVVREVKRAASRPIVFDVVVDYRANGRPYRVSDERKMFPPSFQQLQPGDSLQVIYLRDEPATASVLPLPDEICRERPEHRNCLVGVQ